MELPLNEPLLYKRLISPDGTTTAVNVTLNLPQKRPDRASRGPWGFARDLAAEFQQNFPGTRIALTGMAPLNAAFFRGKHAGYVNLNPDHVWHIVCW